MSEDLCQFQQLQVMHPAWRAAHETSKQTEEEVHCLVAFLFKCTSSASSNCSKLGLGYVVLTKQVALNFGLSWRTNNDCLLKAVLLWIGLWCPRLFKRLEEVEEPCRIFVIFLQMEPSSRSCHNIPHKHMSGFWSGFVHKCYVHYCWQVQRPLRISNQDN
jgi:hypothetical protein